MKSPQLKRLKLKVKSPVQKLVKGAGYQEYLQGTKMQDVKRSIDARNILESSGLNGMGGLGLGARATPADNMSQLSERGNTVRQESVNLKVLDQRFKVKKLKRPSS